MKSTKKTKSVPVHKDGFELKYDTRKRVKVSEVGTKIIVPCIKLCNKKYI